MPRPFNSSRSASIFCLCSSRSSTSFASICVISSLDAPFQYSISASSLARLFWRSSAFLASSSASLALTALFRRVWCSRPIVSPASAIVTLAASNTIEARMSLLMRSSTRSCSFCASFITASVAELSFSSSRADFSSRWALRLSNSDSTFSLMARMASLEAVSIFLRSRSASSSRRFSAFMRASSSTWVTTYCAKYNTRSRLRREMSSSTPR